MYKGQKFKIDDFSGGYCGALSADSLATNQASDCADIVIVPGGKAIRSRWGWKRANSTSLWSGVFPGAIGGTNEYMFVIGNDKYFTAPTDSSELPYTFTDRTGAYAGTSLSSGWRFNFVPFNNGLYGFLGSTSYTYGAFSRAYGVPISVTETTVADMTALPSFGSGEGFYGGFTANNRLFGFGANTVWWSALGSVDFTAIGSGRADIGTLGENADLITAVAVLENNIALVFKRNSIAQLVLTSAPFPNYTLFRGVGCIGKGGIVTVDGIVYFITPEKRMKATDGTKIIDFPEGANDMFNTIADINQDRVFGYRATGPDYDWIVWEYYGLTGGGTNSFPGNNIIWDLKNKCWLKNLSRYIMLTTRMPNGKVFQVNHYGFVYQHQYYTSTMDFATGVEVFTPYWIDDLDSSASGTGLVTLAGYWQSGWLNPSSVSDVTKAEWVTVNSEKKGTTTSALPSMSYRFDFESTYANTISWTHTATELRESLTAKLYGRGNFIQFKLAFNASGTEPWQCNQIEFKGKVQGQKVQKVV